MSLCQPQNGLASFSPFSWLQFIYEINIFSKLTQDMPVEEKRNNHSLQTKEVRKYSAMYLWQFFLPGLVNPSRINQLNQKDYLNNVKMQNIAWEILLRSGEMKVKQWAL